MIEILVVLGFIALFYSLAVVYLLPEDSEPTTADEKEIYGFFDEIKQHQEKAILGGRTVGVEVWLEGYRTLIYKQGKWEAQSADVIAWKQVNIARLEVNGRSVDLESYEKLITDIRFELELLENKKIDGVFEDEDDKDEYNKLQDKLKGAVRQPPTIVMHADGLLNKFEVIFHAKEDFQRRYLIKSVNDKDAVLEN